MPNSRSGLRSGWRVGPCDLATNYSVSGVTEVLLSIQGLSHSVAGRQLFKDCDLKLAAGDHAVIVGDSGGGKSTLLNLIADQHPAVALADSSPSMVLQEGALLDHLTVTQNLELVKRYTGSNSNLNHLLQSLNLGAELYNAKPNQLSGGQMRRVAIARALITQPSVMLFDEPDAGLDIANLASLAKTINGLSDSGDKACITVSHNPYYIARIATKVLRLIDGKLILVADWPSVCDDENELTTRQMQLQTLLGEMTGGEQHNSSARPKPETEWAVPIMLRGVVASLNSLFHWPRSFSDELKVAGYSLFLSLITGVLFFALVGIMLGSTTVAVVRTLADSALTGVVSWFVNPEDLVQMMRGRFALYLAPAVGGMLFVARSGSIIANWVGEIVRGKQQRALDLVGVPTQQYLMAPNVVALFLGMVAALTLFCVSVWTGGVIATQQLFEIENAHTAMAVTVFDVQQANFWLKTLIYSALVSLIVNAFAFAPKRTAHQVNIHTTKCIIYATLAIALAELLMILL